MISPIWSDEALPSITNIVNKIAIILSTATPIQKLKRYIIDAIFFFLTAKKVAIYNNAPSAMKQLLIMIVTKISYHGASFPNGTILKDQSKKHTPKKIYPNAVK